MCVFWKTWRQRSRPWLGLKESVSTRRVKRALVEAVARRRDDPSFAVRLRQIVKEDEQFLEELARQAQSASTPANRLCRLSAICHHFVRERPETSGYQTSERTRTYWRTEPLSSTNALSTVLVRTHISGVQVPPSTPVLGGISAVQRPTNPRRLLTSLGCPCRSLGPRAPHAPDSLSR